MIISMYSFSQLPIELRTTFELPVWPYHPDPKAKDIFRKFCQDLTIFRYQDDITEDGGKDISAAINFPVTNDLKDGFIAYYSQVYVDGETFRVKKWPAAESFGNPLMDAIKVHPIAKDLMGWFNYNIPVQVSKWNADTIVREVITDLVDGCTEDRGCQGGGMNSANMFSKFNLPKK